jgi:aspartate/methionine/tyrosine aminotransferase
VLLDPGDSILLLDPSYCNYPLQVAWATGAHILRFPVLNDAWEFVADQRTDELSEYILWNEPKVVLLVVPDNPTGQVLSDGFVKAVLESVKQVAGFLVIDFAYKELTFGDLPRYFSWGPTDNFLSVHSGSKWSRSLGRRLGWIEAAEPVIEAIESIQGSSILCPDTLHQMALTRYINEAIEENTLRPYVREVQQQYRIAAQRTVACIERFLDRPYLVPQGGLCTCVKIGTDGARFVKDVLQATGVLFVPGWGFGRTMRDAVRLSYGPLVNDLEAISRGLEKVGRFL